MHLKFMHGLQNLVYTELKYPHYCRCTGPLSDEASEIAKVIAEHNIGYVVIDSAGLACGGDVASSELTIAFFNTLRKADSEHRGRQRDIDPRHEDGAARRKSAETADRKHLLGEPESGDLGSQVDGRTDECLLRRTLPGGSCNLGRA